MRKTERSDAIYEASRQVIPGGVSSPVRAFKGVGGTPFVARKAAGAYLWDVDDNRYIDYVGSWGPLILGHADQEVVNELQAAVAAGTSYGCPTEKELELCRLITELVPSMDMVRLVNSGTEATMSAIRLARGYTDRPIIVKFNGCYHGHVDSLLVKAGSGLATLGTPSSAGVPADLARHTLSLPFNDLSAVEKAFKEHPDSIAGIIVEPVAGNMGCIPPADGYLEGLRSLCDQHGTCLIFDEVMTGFRVALGGAQERYGIRPDISAFGKIIGGGLPVGAYGGKREIMEKIAPLGPVYQAGTLSGNPLATTAGLVTLRRLADREDAIYNRLETLGAKLEEGLLSAATDAGLPATVNRVGSMLTLFFSDGPVVDQATSSSGPDSRYGTFFHSMLDQGVFLAPSRYECAFLSTAHTDDDLKATITAARVAAQQVASTE